MWTSIAYSFDHIIVHNIVFTFPCVHVFSQPIDLQYVMQLTFFCLLSFALLVLFHHTRTQVLAGLYVDVRIKNVIGSRSNVLKERQ